MEALIRLEKEQIEKASQVLARAFHNDPETVAFIPDEKKRQKLLYAMFKMALGYSIGHGEVYAVSPAIEGVAVWLPSAAPEMSFWTMLRGGGLGLIFSTSWGLMRNMKKDEDFANKLRKQLASFPHWYLGVLGVDPDFQGKGYASRLLKPMLARLDSEGMPAYLETSVEGYVPMYSHFSFEVIKETTLPASGTRMWVMLRDKRGGKKSNTR